MAFSYQRWKRAARGERQQAYDPQLAALDREEQPAGGYCRMHDRVGVELVRVTFP